MVRNPCSRCGPKSRQGVILTSNQWLDTQSVDSNLKQLSRESGFRIRQAYSMHDIRSDIVRHPSVRITTNSLGSSSYRTSHTFALTNPSRSCKTMKKNLYPRKISRSADKVEQHNKHLLSPRCSFSQEQCIQAGDSNSHFSGSAEQYPSQ
jgi:hypothetical protein